MEARALLWHSTIYHKSRLGSRTTSAQKKNVPFSFAFLFVFFGFPMGLLSFMRISPRGIRLKPGHRIVAVSG
jgi:hypothetical protein